VNEALWVYLDYVSVKHFFYFHGWNPAPNVFGVPIHNLLLGRNRRSPEPLSDSESIRIYEVQHCADSGLSVFARVCFLSGVRPQQSSREREQCPRMCPNGWCVSDCWRTLLWGSWEMLGGMGLLQLWLPSWIQRAQVWQRQAHTTCITSWAIFDNSDCYTKIPHSYKVMCSKTFHWPKILVHTLSSLVLTICHQGCIYWSKKSVKTVILWNIIKITLLLICNLLSQSWIFSIITPVFSVPWSFRNNFNILICFATNIYDYHQCWKQLCCLVFL